MHEQVSLIFFVFKAQPSTQKIHQEILHASYKNKEKCIPSKRSAMPRILCWLDQEMDGIPTCRRI